jgi:ubiquinone/menaquinone biosynthesis C-methylase UbiE
VYAVDIAPRFLEHINREGQKVGQKNVTCVLGGQDSINIPPNTCDLIFVCDTYHHFEYPASTLKSIHSALKPQGRLVLIDFDRIEGQSREWILNHLRAGKSVFRAEIEAAGFTLVEEKQIAGFKENYFLIFNKK